MSPMVAGCVVPPDPRLSAGVRSGRAWLRGALLSGEMTLAEVLDDPRAADVLLVDVVRWQYRGAAPHAMALLGRAAARDNVNLLLQVRASGEHTKAWLVTHGRRWTRKAKLQVHLLNEDELFALWQRKGPQGSGGE